MRFISHSLSPGGNQDIQREPRDTVNSQNTNILHRRPNVPGGQGHNAIKSRLGWNDVANDRQQPTYPDQSAYNGYCDKHKHDDLDIDHANHQALGELTNKQANQCSHKGRQHNQRQQQPEILPRQSEADTRRYNRGQATKEKALSAPFENVDFRRNGVSFLTGQHTGVIQP